MNRQTCAAFVTLVFGVVLIAMGVLCEVSWAQSPLVFMTVDDIFPAVQTKLVRFDSGVETFGVNAGAASAFQGVATLNNELLVADYGNEQIQRFAQNGIHLGSFASINNPTYLESDGSNNVYATHSSLGPAVVTRFNSSGNITQTYSHPNLATPGGVDADATGNVYVVDIQGVTAEIFKFASNGTFLNSIPLASSAFDLSIDELGQRLYLASGAQGIRIFDISGAQPVSVGSIATPANSSINGIHYSTTSVTVLATSIGSPGFGPRGLEYSLGGTLLDEYFASGAEVAFDIVTPAIPEPASLVMLVLSMVGVGLRARCGKRL